MPPSNENIIVSAVAMITANAVLFAAFSWLWKEGKALLSDLLLLALFFVNLAMFLISAALGAYGKGSCRHLFSIGCLTYFPMVMWVYVCLRKNYLRQRELDSKSKRRKRK